MKQVLQEVVEERELKYERVFDLLPVACNGLL